MNLITIVEGLLKSSGYATMTWQQLVMLVLSFILMYLAIVKQFEPLLLLPISFGIFMSNLPHSGTFEYFYQLDHWYDAGILGVMYMGVKSSFFPCMMFLAVGAMTDFGPLIARPSSLLMGAAAQFGVFVALLGAMMLDFNAQEAGSIGIIGGADGPTSIYLASKMAPHLLGAIAVAAYTYMALVPLIQPPIMKLFTTKREREVVMELLAGVERVLGQRPRLIVPEGIQLVTQGEPVGAVYLVLGGQVSLHRDSAQGEVLAHLASSGPLIGLVSLARAENAFFTGETATEATLVRLTTEQLQIVISEDPSIGATLTALAIRSLTRRLMRAEDLHLQNAMLAEDLEAQKEALAATLEDLRATRAELVERARFAMLGELSAGIAHELNNPVTALVRAAKHLHEDVDAALAAPATASSREAMSRALTAPPRSTSVERALMKELLPVVGDRTLARRLVRAGIQGADGARALAQIPGGIDAYEAGARLGGSLRSVLAAGDRVIELTQSLKGYARPDAEDLKPVDVREGIDDVLRLTAHRVRGIRIDCDYEDVPLVRAHPAKLQQVWTNLIVNAAEAIEDENADLIAAAEASGGVPELPARGEAEALIRITVRPTPEGVAITVCDNGPGIDPGIVDKIMEPHFTTKAGRIRFGLGMGMSIVRSIIADHGGTLVICSHPGSTTMRISLPTQPQEEES